MAGACVAFAATDADSVAYELNEVQVSASGKSAINIVDGSTIRFNPAELALELRSMGEADVINTVKQMSGITTAGDYGAGLMIDGAEASQVLYRIARVPVFFPYRFGGIFSTFNTSHFNSVTFARSMHPASMPARLGARFDFDTSDFPAGRFGGMANVGLLSSSATVRIPFCRHFSVTASARVSYVDEIYGKFLQSSHSSVKYNFADFNVTANYSPDENNALSLNMFVSRDNLHYSDDNYAMSTGLRWKNALVALRWRHIGASVMNHRLYWSGFSNRLGLDLPQFGLAVPSSLAVAGVAGDLSGIGLSEKCSLAGGYELQLYRNSVQSVSLSGYGAGDYRGEPELLRPVEARVYADAGLELLPSVRLMMGISTSVFHNSDGYTAFSIDPRATLSVEHGIGTFRVHLGRYSQFVHQVGFSETGMSSDFWITSCRGVEMQSAFGVDADYAVRTLPSGLSFSVGAYWRRVFGQPEYIGQILDLLDRDYSPENHIISGNGFNIGARCSANLDVGRFTAAAGVGYGIARRRFPGSRDLFRGRTDPGLSFNARTAFRIDGHWTAGADFRFSSGRPYTPARAVYVMAGNLITEYGAPNSARFPPYHRLDISATWQLRGGSPRSPLRHIVNVSVINVYGRRNVELRKYVIDVSNGGYRLKEVSSLYRFLPSISYTVQF